MTISRRRLLQIMATAGLSIPVGQRFLPLYEAYAQRRPAHEDLRGPGIITFSRSVCRDCANHCSLAIRLMDDLPVGLRGTSWHPATKGALCVAGQSQMQALFDPDRLHTPLVRADAGEAAEPTSWPDALGGLQGKLGSLVDRGQGDRLVVVDGRTPSLGTSLVESWVQSIPGASYVSLRIEQAMDRLIAGFLGGQPTGRLHFDLARSGTLLLVGFEMLEIDGSPVTQMRAHGDRREDSRFSNMPTIYLGPRRSPTAAKADLWIPCNPGQERDILLGLAESLSRQHPQRDQVMKQYARWIPEAAEPVEFARHYSLENVCRRQGLDFDELLAVEQALVVNGPSLVLGGPGLLRRRSGAADARAALALNLWTGGLDQPDVFSWRRDPLQEIARAIGFPTPRRNNPATLQEMFKPLLKTKRSSIDILICIEANLAHELPGLDQVKRALLHIPYVVSLAPYEDEISQLSHLTLPTLLDLESWDIPAPAWGVPQPFVQIQRPAVDPVVDGRAVEDVFLALADAGVRGAEFEVPANSAQELVEQGIGVIIRGRRGTLIDREGHHQLSSVDSASAAKALLDGEAGWLDDTALAATDRATAHPVTILPKPQGDLAPDQNWLVVFDNPAIQSGRVLNRPMMMELSGFWHGLAWESWIEIHPDDARRTGISNGDGVLVRGPRTEIQARAVVTRSVVPGCVAMPQGLGHLAHGQVARGHGANPMGLPSVVFDEETGVPAWGPVPVFIKKA